MGSWGYCNKAVFSEMPCISFNLPLFAEMSIAFNLLKIQHSGQYSFLPIFNATYPLI